MTYYNDLPKELQPLFPVESFNFSAAPQARKDVSAKWPRLKISDQKEIQLLCQQERDMAKRWALLEATITKKLAPPSRDR